MTTIAVIGAGFSGTLLTLHLLRYCPPPTRLLLGPGPSDAHPRVLTAMATPLLGHLDPAFLELMLETQDMLRQAFRVATTGSPGPVHLQIQGNEGQLDTQTGVLDDIGDEPRERCDGVAQDIALDGGLIIAGGNIERRAHAGDGFRDGGGRVRRGALLQVVGHQVGEPDLLRAFVDGTGADTEGHRGDGQPAEGDERDTHAVGEGELVFRRQCEVLGRRRGGRGLLR